MAKLKQRIKDLVETRYFFLFLFFVLCYLSYVIYSPFLPATFAGIIFSYLVSPFYRFLEKYIKGVNSRAVICTFVVFLVLSIPVFMIVSSLTREDVVKESNKLYTKTMQRIYSGKLFDINCRENDASFACSFNKYVNNLLESPQAKDTLTTGITTLINTFTKHVTDFLLSFPKFLINLFITVLATFYFLRDGKELYHRIMFLLPLKEHHKKQLLVDLKDIMYGVLYGTLLVALIQGVWGGIGFALFGISNYIFIAFLITFFSLIPAIGTWVIWVPVVFYEILSASATGGQGILYFILLIIFGLSISTVDNFVKPFIVGRRTKLNAMLILAGVVGGVWLFGLVGFIFGPVILAVTKVFFEMYETEKKCEK